MRNRLAYPCLTPCEGARAFPILLDFTAAVENIVNMLAAQAAGELSMLKTLYIDNSKNSQPVTVYIPVSEQEIDVPADAQGYVGLLSPNPPLVNFTSQGNVKVNAFLLNFYMPTQFWGNAIYNPPGATSFLIELESGAGFLELESGTGLIELETGP